jgi:hypothetical protein
VLSGFIYVLEDLLTGKCQEVHARRIRFFRNSDFRVTQTVLDHLSYQAGELHAYISGRDQVELSKARSKSTTANNLCFRYSGGRSICHASLEKQYKTRVGEPKALRPPDLKWLERPLIYVMF